MKAVIRLLLLIVLPATAVMATDLAGTETAKNTAEQQPEIPPERSVKNQETKPNNTGTKTSNDLTNSESPPGFTPSSPILSNTSPSPEVATQPVPQVKQRLSPRKDKTSTSDLYQPSANWAWSKGDPELGFNTSPKKPMDGDNNQVFNYLHDEFRLLAGEDIYAKVVWTYFDLKELDEWIYSNANRFNFGSNQIFPQHPVILTLDNHLLAGLILGPKNAEWHHVQNLNASFDSTDDPTRQLMTDKSIARDEPIESSPLFKLLKFFSIKNFIYLLLAITGLIFTVKVFKFFVRQQ